MNTITSSQVKGSDNSTPNIAENTVRVPDLGQVAYDAYCATRDWKSLNGTPLLQWDAVKIEIQSGWDAAATAVLSVDGDLLKATTELAAKRTEEVAALKVQLHLLRRESTSVVQQFAADVTARNDENAALRLQVGELQAEAEGLVKVKVCDNCALLNKPLRLCVKLSITVTPGFGCNQFTAKKEVV